ncbi:MAG: signal peptidase II [Wolinella sp.]
MVEVRLVLRALCVLVAIFAIDQLIKWVILGGFRWESEVISITFALNKGVAFSMFAFLDEWLKYLQLGLLGGIAIFLARDANYFREHYLAFSILLGAGFSNVLDRFLHGGVVDYVYWHYGFEFAIFNFADVMIDFAVALLLWQTFFKKK